MSTVIESKAFSIFVLSIIVLNTIAITLQISKTLWFRYGWYFSVLDNFFLGVYVIEITIKIYVWRRNFCESGWNNFGTCCGVPITRNFDHTNSNLFDTDLFIVLSSILEVASLIGIGQAAGVDPKILRLLRILKAVRAIRALRVLRTITFLKSLQLIVNTLLRSIPAMGSIFALLSLVTCKTYIPREYYNDGIFCTLVLNNIQNTTESYRYIRRYWCQSVQRNPSRTIWHHHLRNLLSISAHDFG